jgi:hypothetical protein
MQSPDCGLPSFVPAIHYFSRRRKNVFLLAPNQKVIAERKSNAALEALFESLLHHLKTGTIRGKAGKL